MTFLSVLLMFAIVGALVLQAIYTPQIDDAIYRFYERHGVFEWFEARSKRRCDKSADRADRQAKAINRGRFGAK